MKRLPRKHQNLRARGVGEGATPSFGVLSSTGDSNTKQGWDATLAKVKEVGRIPAGCAGFTEALEPGRALEPHPLRVLCSLRNQKPLGVWHLGWGWEPPRAFWFH